MARLTTFLTLRVAQSTRDKFRNKSKAYGGPTVVHRELIEAFLEDRLTIKPNADKPTMEKLYVD